MAAALLVGLPLAWGLAPSDQPERGDDRFRRRLERLTRRKLSPAEVRWPPRP